MKIIGLLGGMSWESTAHYYRIINEEVRKRLGGLHSAKVVLYSVDFAHIAELQSNGDWKGATQVLCDAAKGMDAAGAECLVICTNTMHKVADEVSSAVPIPLIHIADVTAECIKAKGVRRVLLLATRFTMEQDFYRQRLARHGLEVVIPGSSDREIVHRVIYEELCRGAILDESRQHYRRIIEEMVRDGVEGVILGCTEIGILLSAKDSSVPLFDTTRIHAEAAVAFALGKAG
ncbi:MAG: hypothetical protein RIS36_1498 [Pseudomonadota bacterium]|jgi:aspartate racemase